MNWNRIFEHLETIGAEEIETWDLVDETKYTVCVLRDRVCFEDASGKPQDAPTHANFVCYAGTRKTAFEGVFDKYGKVKL